jgi:hypothetical protein
MSAEGTIYGCIFGGGLLGSAHDFTFQHNKDVIERLPNQFEQRQNFVLRQMFSVPQLSDFPKGGFYRSQMIHFAASYNHLDTMWKQWLQEFEDLLTKLYWHEAYVHVYAEMYMEADYSWKADTTPLFENLPKTIQKWEFSGGVRDWGTDG